MKTQRTSLMAIIFIAFFAHSYAQVQTPKYVSTTGNSGGFYEYLPSGYWGSGQTYPLIVFIHGVGELGDGVGQLSSVLNGGLPRVISSGQFPSSFNVGGVNQGFLVISPQFRNWPSNSDVNDVINYAIQNYRVNTSRIYVTGLSMGGGVTWETAAAYASRIAAIVPVCGASYPEQNRAKSIASANVAVWATHNDYDGTVPSFYTKDYVSYISQAGGNAKKTIWGSASHDAWSQTYDPNFRENGLNIYEWMLQYQKGGSTLVISAVPTANDFSSVASYSGRYSYGVNPGYYGSNWTAENLSVLAMGSSSLSVKGVGAKSLRVPLYDDHLSTYGLTAELSKLQYYASLGAQEMTAFVGSPSPSHRETTTFPGASEPAKTFKGLYEPIWTDASQTQVNPNNTFAQYLYNVVKTYGPYVKFWEVVNEPDFTSGSGGWAGDMNPPMSGSWFERNPSPEELTNLKAPIFYYIRMLKVSWEVIKKLSPSSYVCTGGIGYRSFLDAVLRNTDNPVDGSITSQYPLKGGAYFDVVSFHNYPMYGVKAGTQYQRNSDGAVGAFLLTKENMERLVSSYGYNGSQYPNKVFICTETGVSRTMSGDLWGSNEGQKNYLLKAQVAAQKASISQLYWFCLGDFSGSDQYSQMGLYRYFGNASPYNATPSDQGIALKTTSDLLYSKTYDAQRTAALSLPSSVDGAAFRATDGSYTYVLWAKTTSDLLETASATYSFSSSVVSQTLSKKEWNFSQTNSSSTINPSSIQLSASPIFLQIQNGNVGPTPAPTPTPTPTVSVIPGKVEAESYSSMRGVQTEYTQDAGGGQNVGWIDPSDWMDYNVNVTATGSYTVNFRIATTANNAQFQLKKADGTVLATVNVPNTWGYQFWQTVSATVNLSAGTQTLRIISSSPWGSVWNINWADFSFNNSPSAIPVPTPPTTGTSTKIEAENYSSMSGIQTEWTQDAGGGQNVGWIDQWDWMNYSYNAPSSGTYTVNLRVATPNNGAQLQLTKPDGTLLSSVNIPNTWGYQAYQTISTTINLSAGQQTIRVQSSSGAMWNINWLEIVSSSSATTPSTPTKIEAESYSSMSGVQTEYTQDAGGGQNVGWIDRWDWMDYSYNAPSSGTYTVNLRVATPNNGAQLQLTKGDATLLATVNVPNTGGYQSYQTVSTTINLSAGQQTIRVQSSSGAMWNINWLEIVSSGSATTPSTPTTGTSTKIEAESYSSMSGIQTEWTQDAGGGQNVGWIDQWDWMNYSYNAPSSGTYTVNLRVASPNNGAQLQLTKPDGTLLSSVNIPNTWGYQAYQTISTTINLSAGQQTIRVQSSSGAVWNINWLEIVSSSSATTPSTPTTGTSTKIEAESYSSMSGVQT